MREYFTNLPGSVQAVIFAVLTAFFGYFGYNAVFTEDVEPEVAVEAVSELEEL